MVKKLLLVLVVVGLCSTVALALDPMGPPTAGLKKGQWSAGVEYSYSKMNITRRGGYEGDLTGKYQVAKVEAQKVYANIGYGLSDNVVGFVRLGIGQGDFDRGTSEDTSILWHGNGDTEFIWGAGIKATLTENERVAWGLLAQYGWGRYEGTEKRATKDDRDYDNRMDELQIAIGPTFKLADAISIYGGPFLHYIRGEMNEDADSAGDKAIKSIGQKNEFGGYVGSLIKIAENTDLTVEYQYTGEAWALAGGVTFSF